MNAISVRNLSKEFRMEGRKPRYRNFKDLLHRRASPDGSEQRDRFQALKDVSFDIEPGQIVGVIGRNGAGKSTLLKILSRTLRPTRGRIELRGRVGSLLEVGAGFHQDLTGRENIFLNAAILGMGYREIVTKLDDIVAFAAVEKYLDEPVKHYSSGMYMRLAFAVAAHIEPEILLLDEVLAVGDAEFQKKSLERIQQVGRHGQTVLLVSHDIQTVLRLCDRALCLDQGRLAAFGDPAEVTAHYLGIGGGTSGARRYGEGPYAPGDSVVRLRGVAIRDCAGAVLESVDIGRAFGIEVEFEVLTGGFALFPCLTIMNERGPALWATDSGSTWHGRERPAGVYRETAWIPAHLLSPGAMRVTCAVHSFRPNSAHFIEPDAVTFQAVETAGGARGDYVGRIESAVRPLLRWDVERC